MPVYIPLARCVCRAYGDAKHCRKLFQRILNSVSDWPESISEAYIQFEREEGLSVFLSICTHIGITDVCLSYSKSISSVDASVRVAVAYITAADACNARTDRLMQCIVTQLLDASMQRSKGMLQRLHCCASQDGSAHNNGGNHALTCFVCTDNPSIVNGVVANLYAGK